MQLDFSLGNALKLKSLFGKASQPEDDIPEETSQDSPLKKLTSRPQDYKLEAYFEDDALLIRIKPKPPKKLNANSSFSLESFGTRIGDGLSTGFKSGADGQTLGSWLMTGLRDGIKNYQDLAVQAAYEAATAVYAAAKSAVDSNSPSKKFMELGMYCDQGLAIGIQKFASAPEDAIETASKQALTEAGNLVANLSTLLASEDYDPTVTVRPILDMNELATANGTIDAMLGAKSVNVTASRSSDIASDVARSAPAAINYEGSFAAIGEKITQLQDAIYSMSVVMDSGALVGQIKNKLDVSLGTSARYKMRGM